MTRKVNPMRYSDYLVSCATSLAAEKQVPSDVNLIYHLRLVNGVEKICDTFGYNESSQPRHMTDEQILVYINALSTNMHEWKSSLPSSLASDGTPLLCPISQVNWSYCPLTRLPTASYVLWPEMIEAYIREIGVHGTSRGSSVSVARITMLYDCLLHVKNYLDTLLSLPIDQLQNWTTVEWTWFNYAMILITNISLAVQSPAWNIETARTALKLEMYIDCLSARLKELYSLITPADGAIDWYGYLLVKLETGKNRYLAALNRTAPAGMPLSAAANVHHTTSTSTSQTSPGTDAVMAQTVNPGYVTTAAPPQTMAGFDSLAFSNEMGGMWMPSRFDAWSFEDIPF